jgi:ABC-type molybdate transport system substrate-binding protein
MAEHKANLFLTYCTNAMEAAREVAGSHVVTVPAALAVGAGYGVTTKTGAPASATAFVRLLISPEGSRILARHGFAPATD